MAADEIRLWAMDGAGGAARLAEAAQTDTERLLEDTLVRHPELLLAGLSVVGRQVQTPGGPLDLLGVDDDGRLVVFELKRGTVTREAVAQVLDYASFLEFMPDVELADFIAAGSGTHGAESIGDFAEWYESKSGGQELSALKPVRMALVGLGVDERATRMAQLLAGKGVDFSLLTFHGFTYNGATLLARQMPVAAADETERAGPRRPSGGRLGRRARWERLSQVLQETAEQRPEVKAMWDAALDMFRENFPGIQENPSGGVSDWARRRLQLRLPRKGPIAALQLGPDANHPASLLVIFFPVAVGACLPEFVQLRRELPYQTYPQNDPQRMREGILEIQFYINSLAEWESCKERLAAVTRSVYEALRQSDDDGEDEE